MAKHRYPGAKGAHASHHGDAGKTWTGARGPWPVVGFALAWTDSPRRAVYFSGDTVWYEGVAQVATRFDLSVALLYRGAARVREVLPDHLTFTADEAVQAARAFRSALIAPLHYEGWAHLSESPTEVAAAFVAAGLGDRLLWLPKGEALVLPGPDVVRKRISAQNIPA